MQLSLAYCALPLLLLAACASTERQRVPPPDPALPFSRAVMVGDTCYVAGHLGRDPQTGEIPADPAEEASNMLIAFTGTLREFNMTMDDLVQVQVFCSDVSLYNTFNKVYRDSFTGDEFPARAFIGSGPLLRGARFEINGIAVRPDR